MSVTPVYVGLAVLAAILVAIYATALWRTQLWTQGSSKPALKGLALPEGSIRGLIAFLVVGAFVIFVFFGRRAVDDDDLFTTVLTAFGTLTGSVTGFYFGGRASQAASEAQGGTEEGDRRRPKVPEGDQADAPPVEMEGNQGGP
jgi:hypothetical protein